MKKYRAAQIIAGIFFFALAAVFSFSLLDSLFTDGTGTNGFANFAFYLGNILRKTYGICSILIPVFFFAVSMICLVAKITFKKCIYISFSLIPFFTAVLSQHIYKSQPHNMLAAIESVKLILTIIATLLIMAIEFLMSGIIAERIAYKIYKSRHSETNETENDDAFEFSEMQPKSKLFSSKHNSVTENLKFSDEPSFVKNEERTLADIQFEKELEEYKIRKEENETAEYTVLQKENEPEESNNLQEDKDIFTDDYDDDEHDTLEQQFNNLVTDEEQEAFEKEFSDEQSDDIPAEEEFSDIDIEEDFSEQPALEEQTLEEPISEEPVSEEQTSNENISENQSDNSEQKPDSDIESINTNPADISETDGISDVFSQMEADIERQFENEQKSSEPENQEPDSAIENQTAAPQTFGTKSVKEAEAEIREEKKSSRKIRKGAYKIPTDGLLNEFEDQEYWIIDGKTNDASAQLKETLEEFKIAAEVTGIRKGPVVTMFEILPAPGVKLSKIVQLQDNIALRLAASSVRIVAPIPGKRAVGIEVPNENRAIVTFRELIEQNLPEYKKMAVPVVLGKDIQGEAQLLDIAKTPHLLIAGSTGSGKSVCVNSIILSILYKKTPDQVKLILVDPKIVELKLYNDIPHLLTPVITEPKKALQSLQYCLCEMERRYALLDGLGCRDIVSYNKRIEERHIATEKLPYIVVIIDEFADLMATTGKELESTIARLCAMSRAVGIHLVLATQRPSIDVITGLIKANIPSRIAFMVASKMDSRIIIDQVGAEKLLGRGDMLYASATDPFPVRIQGTYVSDDEVENVVEYVKGFGEPEYIDDEIFVETDDDEMAEPGLFGGGGEDPLYNKALEIVMQAGKASASYLQRRLSIGYNRAARLVEDMEARGIVGPANGSKPREIIHVPG